MRIKVAHDIRANRIEMKLEDGKVYGPGALEFFSIGTLADLVETGFLGDAQRIVITYNLGFSEDAYAVATARCRNSCELVERPELLKGGVSIAQVHIGFSEAPGVKGMLFKGENALSAANAYLSRVEAPKGGGYYKTDFTITFEDGLEYSGRYDIGSDCPTLQEHCRNFSRRVVANKYSAERAVEFYGKMLPRLEALCGGAK